MFIKDVTQALEEWAPKSLQESYDNSGLQVGEPGNTVSGILIALDVTVDVVRSAIAQNCNLIIAHHPLIFSGLKSITRKNSIEECIWMAIKNDISIYAIHTNLDNIFTGVNSKICEKLGLLDLQILEPKSNELSKLVTYVPVGQTEQILKAMWAAGAGNIGHYRECSFSAEGKGSFKPGEQTHPSIGQAGGERQTVAENRVEVLVENSKLYRVITELKNAHPYEEVAYDILPIKNEHNFVGAGMLGTLPEAFSQTEFLKLVKKQFQTQCIRYTTSDFESIHKVAVCGGSGSFLLSKAQSKGAHAFVTADFKYHQFFESESKIMITDIGHYESEQFTSELIHDYLTKKFTTFAILLYERSTNPIKYFS